MLLKTRPVSLPTFIFDLSQIKYEIERFLLNGEFDLIEDDRTLARTDGDRSTAEFSFGKLILSCWGDGWSRSWRIIFCELATHRLRLECAKQMGLKRCEVVLSRGSGARIPAHERRVFARKLTALIEANIAGVRVERAVAARNDRLHLSGVYTRLVIRDRKNRFAGIGVSESELQQNIEGVLTAGLTWMTELVRKSGSVDGLMIFAPRCDTIAIRLSAIAPTATILL